LLLVAAVENVLALSSCLDESASNNNRLAKERNVAKPNYQGEKRRKDLAKKAKKEEKRLRKLEAKDNPSSEDADAPESAGAPEGIQDAE
jgi:hypothetical protein